jgi:hypothetical protein
MADRDRLWRFTRDWWQRELDAAGLTRWPIVEGHHDDGGPFNRSAAVNAAARRADEVLGRPWQVAVIIDADVLVGLHQVVPAVAAAAAGRVGIAFTERLHLDRHGTAKVLEGWRGNWRRHARLVAMESCSSAVTCGRELWEQVGGFDEQFVGWGWEDVAFRVHAEAVAAHPLVRIGGPLWHLHHLVSAGNNRAEPTFRANQARGEAYVAHQWDPDALAELRARQLVVAA